MIWRITKWLFIVSVLWRVFGPLLTPRFRAGQEHPWKIPASTVFVGDHEFLVRQVGDQSKPDIVLIHGLGGASLTEWYEIGPRLLSDFRLTIVENRSHGLSPRFTASYEVADVADDVAAVMQQVGLQRAHVVGYSMGGTVAQALAYRHASMVDRLVLIATFSFHPPSWKWARVAGAVITRAWERVTGTGTPEVRTGYLLATGAVKPQHAQFMWEETHRRDTDAGAAASMALFRFDSRAWVENISQPTLIMIPSRDQLVPVAWQHDLASRIEGSTVRMLEGAHHEVVWTHPEEIATALHAFLAPVQQDRTEAVT